MRYVIIPREGIIHAVIGAATPGDALIDFATTMDTDMNKYFMAIPEEEYAEYCAKQDAEAHKRFVVNWMKNTIMEDFPVYNEDIAHDIAERAYEIYSEGNGDTEYESVQKAYDKAYATKIVVCNIQWDWDRDSVEFVLEELENVDATIKRFKLDIPTVQATEDCYEELIDLCCDSPRHNKVTPEDIFGLPNTVEVPGTFCDEQITEYLSDEFGFCIKGYARSAH